MRKVFLTPVLALSVLMTKAQTRAGGSSSSKTPAGSAFAVFATNGATINVSGITINNTKSVSRGLHCTGGGIINATNVNVTCNGAADEDNNAKLSTVTVESGAVWNLTGNSYVSILTNNGTINKLP